VMPEAPVSKPLPVNPEIAKLEAAILADEKQLSTTQFSQRIEQAALEKVTALGPVCNTCGQAVDESYRAGHTEEHEKNLTGLQLAGERLKATIAKAKFKLRTLKAEQEKKEAEAAETAAILRRDDLAKYQAEVSRWRLAQNALTEAVGKKRTAEFQVSAKQATHKKLLQDQERLKQATNPFISLLADAGKKQAEYAKKIEELEQTCIGLRATISDFAYWKDGFRRIRILAVQQALKQLEIAINDGLVQLGLRGWSILLDAERELTNGSIKREFVINVQSPYNQELVPWESFSGGERQRLRMAFLFGLQSFMTQRTGVEPSLLFVDEPTTWLSEGGIGDMLNFLAMKAKRDNLQVWLADHRTLDFGDFTGHLVVVKTAEGSHIEKGN
jgi:DNA repair exonuclease SbcCD ATPase subunit